MKKNYQLRISPHFLAFPLCYLIYLTIYLSVTLSTLRYVHSSLPLCRLFVFITEIYLLYQPDIELIKVCCRLKFRC